MSDAIREAMGQRLSELSKEFVTVRDERDALARERRRLTTAICAGVLSGSIKDVVEYLSRHPQQYRPKEYEDQP